MNFSVFTQNAVALAGRLLIALLFMPAGWRKLTGFAGTSAYIASKGVPFPELCAALAIGIELGLPLLLVMGWRARWVALGLAIFVAVITPIFHNFWVVLEAQMLQQQSSFFKNVGILGGLLMLVAFGPGGWSMDASGKGSTLRPSVGGRRTAA